MAGRWTDEEDSYLRAHPKGDLELLARVLQRSSDAVRRRLYKIQRTAKPNDYLGVEMAYFLERANRPLPISTNALPTLPASAASTANLSKWKPPTSRRGGNAFRNTKTGYRPDLGLTVRSAWEANVCRILKSYEIPFVYEPAVFTFPVKRGNRAYTPDLYLTGANEWIEIKGWFDKDSQIKMKRFKKYYPQEWDNLTMIISKSSKQARNFCALLDVPNLLFYQDLTKLFKDRIAGWEP